MMQSSDLIYFIWFNQCLIFPRVELECKIKRKFIFTEKIQENQVIQLRCVYRRRWRGVVTRYFPLKMLKNLTSFLEIVFIITQRIKCDFTENIIILRSVFSFFVSITKTTNEIYYNLQVLGNKAQTRLYTVVGWVTIPLLMRN